MDTKVLNVLIEALKNAEQNAASGLPAVGLTDFQSNQRVFGTRGMERQTLKTWSEYQGQLNALKETSLTANTSTLYGCTSLFGLCGPDEVIGLSLMDDKLSAWMEWFPNDVCEQFVKFLTYADVEGTAAGSPQTTAGAACDDPPKSEKGTFEIFLGDKGLLRVSGEPVVLTKIGERKCDKQPIYTLPFAGAPGGVRIDNDLDFEAIVAAEALKNDLSRHLITGDKGTTGEFDGLEQLVNTGYVDIKTGTTNSGIDSLVVAWSNDNFDGAVNGKGNIISWVIALVRRIRQRVQMAGRGTIAVGDLVLVMTTEMRDAFLDAFACYGLCTPSAYNEIFRDNLAVREFRDQFNGGLFGDGYITVDGIAVPIVTHDWLPRTQSGTKHVSDIYILTRRMGASRVLYGQYHPMTQGVDKAREFGAGHYRLMQGDRLVQWIKWDNLCVQTSLAVKPNIYLSAPWAQARITNVGVDPLLDPISLDPQSSYFLSAKRVATPMPQYWYQDGVWVQNKAGTVG